MNMQATNKLPPGLTKIAEAPCPWCAEPTIQHNKSAIAGFCPRCRKPTRWTGSTYVKRGEESDPRMKTVEREWWELTRRIHCSHPCKKQPGHACQGTVSMTPTAMTMDCTLCGFMSKRPGRALPVVE